MPSKSKTILIVDDDAGMRELMRDILEGEGYTLFEATDGKEAWAILTTQTIDLVITDRSMPGMGGIELLRKIKEAKKKIATLMISAYGEEKMWSDAISSGAQDYILKPFKADAMLKIVKKILSGERS